MVTRFPKNKNDIIFLKKMDILTKIILKGKDLINYKRHRMFEFGKLNNNHNNNTFKVTEKTLRMYNFTRIVHNCPPRFNNFEASLEIKLKCPNLFLIVIESMSLGVLITKQQAEEFGYITMLRYHNNAIFTNLVNKNYVPVLSINHEWDTSKWTSASMQNFPDWVEKLEGQTLKTILEKKNKREYGWEHIDVEFIKAMSWRGILSPEDEKTDSVRSDTCPIKEGDEDNDNDNDNAAYLPWLDTGPTISPVRPNHNSRSV
tara:strand:+ start:485 stop:1261 length:777 start_codon:yes stop_codon:yes gene_type:complete